MQRALNLKKIIQDAVDNGIRDGLTLRQPAETTPKRPKPGQKAPAGKLDLADELG